MSVILELSNIKTQLKCLFQLTFECWFIYDTFEMVRNQGHASKSRSRSYLIKICCNGTKLPRLCHGKSHFQLSLECPSVFNTSEVNRGQGHMSKPRSRSHLIKICCSDTKLPWLCNEMKHFQVILEYPSVYDTVEAVREQGYASKARSRSHLVIMCCNGTKFVWLCNEVKLKCIFSL